MLDRTFAIRGSKTLNEADPTLSLVLEPGSYLVTGMSPNGRRTKIPVTVSAGDALSVAADEQNMPAPEQLIATSSEGQSAQLGQTIGGPPSSAPPGGLSGNGPRRVPGILPDILAGAAYAGLGIPAGLEGRLSRYRDLEEERRKAAWQSKAIDIRTYGWDAATPRWLRSDLVDHALITREPDATRLVFPSRFVVDPALKRKIHLVAAFRKGAPARFLALPLFAEGTQLVLSNADPATGSEAAPGDTQGWDFSWRLSAADPRVDALLQALNGRDYGDRDAVSQEAFKVADDTLRRKMEDPEAAVVAGLFLLQYRRLDKRARWVENLASRFPWSPDAIVLGAWANILFGTGGEKEALSKLARIHAAGPPQFLPSRRLLRDLISILRGSDRKTGLPAETTRLLNDLWARLGREMRREIPGGPFHSFARGCGS
ncbi:hypothetical protein [Pleomorphomonas sp. NRK KF1]|uniref:hypothetical protein n=1 Tax=Pleomorphomonas sp. NRK KF1 TaxID=2943000 RepID=UPI0020437106|nr:hypothetical protein [Pleomorphomonas sp. NRK KF1]